MQHTNILVIDDALDSKINKNLIEILVDNAVVETVNDYQTAIEMLTKQISTNATLLPDYIFLDINIPGASGWQFLKEFERLKINRFKEIHIYVLSYSIYQHDLAKSQANPLIEEYIHKPLNIEKIRTIFSAA